MHRSRMRWLGGAAAVGGVGVLVVAGGARAVESGPAAYSASTSVGVHNAYLQSAFPYFADALDSGAGMLEIDVWTNFFGSGWRVGHDSPFVNQNNCVGAGSPDELRSGDRDQSLAACLTDIRTWHDANPGHRPIQLKLELKDGFADNLGRGPAAFDALVEQTLGDAVFRPADLTGGHASLDAAVTADGWPSRDALAGKFLIHLIPGTVEQGNPFDNLWTDVEYGRHLRDLAAAGELGSATAFPAVLRAEAGGDPRVGRYEESIRPWFVVFDGDADVFVESVDTGWYTDRNYLLVMTNAHNVAPPISGTDPTEREALDRVRQLADSGAAVASSDWTGLPSVLGTVLPH
ncbi:phosphatidylinositol-specific phospholipase C domain-containing protein [Streptomyces sp. DSM 44915]|uniref:Phosphatidylinositol-specific phospholipase C domain-containing protein n=1 Tax=Streptomyces chisholmiae TaxID=3075540 RepID=A0ABU2JIX9_9ACTN|nr:phosphatidylinositol-specific phospholipase C domain-containing protein [Streptomyces sp. DSM 44915]MDT0264877.1 phosphatidylinositol-specific phospholipase C domain-containing protein [Streptomyces sp. DSM 44915]